MWYVSGFFSVFFLLLCNSCFAELEPSIVTLKPLAQKPGKSITVRGKNLSLTTSVEFDSYVSPQINFISNEEIEITVPLPTSSRFRGPWRVSSLVITSPTGKARLSPTQFTILKPDPPPHINWVSPNVGSRKGGDLITLFGSGFSPNATVKFGELPCAQTQWLNSSTLKCQSPGHTAGSVDILVENPDLQRDRLPKGFSFAWTRRIGFEHAISQGEKMAMDAHGNTYVVAEYLEAVDYQQKRGSQSSFLFKLNLEGEEVWKAQIQDNDNFLKINAVSVAENGTIFLAGERVISEDNSRRSIFLAQYSSDGYPIWLKTYFSNLTRTESKKGPLIEKMLLDKVNNIYLIGSTDWDFEGQAPFNGWKAFIVRFNEQGEKLSVIQEGQPNANGYILVLAKTGVIDSRGDLVIAGMSSTALNEDSLGPVGLLFIAKYQFERDSTFARVWVKKIQETDPAVPSAVERISMVTTKTDQTVLFSKYVSSNGSSSPQTFYTLNSISKEGDRHFTRVVRASHPNINLQDHVVDDSGNVYLIGKTNKWCDLSATCKGSDLFLMKYDPNGIKVWERTHFSTASAEVRAGLFNRESIYVVGNVLGEFDNYSSLGQADTLICRFDTDGILR